MTPEILAMIAGATLGLVEVIKRAWLPKDETSPKYENRIRFIPTIALIVAIGLTFMLGRAVNAPLAIQGLIIGLTAMGFYGGAKTTAGK